MATKIKIPEEARRIIQALVNTPPMEKPEPRKKRDQATSFATRSL